jgi:hypothetical protein
MIAPKAVPDLSIRTIKGELCVMGALLMAIRRERTYLSGSVMHGARDADQLL